MKQVSEIHIRVIDHGLFVPTARRLAREAAKVTYWTPTEKPFPTVRDCIGDGFEDVERVYSEWKDADSVDCWCFPDVGFGGMQRELLRQGKIVWGHRGADVLEVNRGRFLEALKSTSLPMPPHEIVTGMERLREYLRGREDVFIKVDKFRGDWETLHWRNWDEDEAELDYRAARLGPWKEVLPFYVFEKIETQIEDGCDTYCIDGQFPSRIIHGMESKDKAYLGTFQALADLPPEVRCVNDEFGPILGGYGYRAFFSCEVRITEDGRSYFIDPTCRAGSPPAQVMGEMIANLGQIIWRGAQGELVDPEPAAKFGVQALVSLKGERGAWRTLKADDELDRWLKCGGCMRIKGRLCFPPEPDSGGNEIGWLVGIGDKPEEAIKHLRHNVELLPEGACCEFEALAELLEEVAAAEERGMEFSPEPMPEPEVVMQHE